MARGELNARPARTASGRIACAGAAAAAVSLLLSVLYQPAAGVPVAVIAALAMLAAARPFDALLVLAGLGPLATVFVAALGGTAGGIHYGEALTLAFLTGAAGRRAFDARPFAVPPNLAWAAAVLMAAVLSSAVVQAAVLRAEQPDLALAGTFPVVLVRDFLIQQNGFTLAMQFAEGILLILLTSDSCGAEPGRRPRLVSMMVAGAAAAAVLNVVRVVTAALRQDAFWNALVFNVTQVRVNVHFADWNAAGSYFAMMLILATLVAWRRPRWTLSAVLLAAALWLTGSRTALAAAACVAGTAGILAARRFRGWQAQSAVAALLLLAAAAAWTWYPAQRNDAAAFSFNTRVALSQAGLRMAADHPVFGVGVGRFYVHSAEYAGDVLSSFGREHENAHNYFVQVLAELGVPGLVLFAAVLAVAVRAASRDRSPDLPGWILAAALVTFLLTCLAGHPLMTPEASYPFWVLAGAAASCAAPAAGPARRIVRWGALILILVYAGSVPGRAKDAVRHADLSNTAIGLSAWQREPDGTRYRLAGARATFFVPFTAGAIVIPMRHASNGPPLLARVFLDGREANRVELRPGEPWQTVKFVTGRQRARGDFRRVDVEVMEAPAAAASPLLAIAQPKILWDVGGDAAPSADEPLLGDLDGDGRADLVVWSIATGSWRWLLSSTSFDPGRAGLKTWREQGLGGVPLLGDLDGDGKADLVVWRAETGTWNWLESSRRYSRRMAVPGVWPDPDAADVPLLADLDGDGRVELVVWHTIDRTWRWLNSSSGYTQTGNLPPAPGAPGRQYLPVAGDFNADGRADLALWSVDPAGNGTLEWRAAASGAAGKISFAARERDDAPLAADIDRDRQSDLLTWRGSTGAWTWLTSSRGYKGAAAGTQQWGNAGLGDVPRAGDLDGDGAADLAVWRASTRTWYWITSSSGYNPSSAGLRPWTP